MVNHFCSQNISEYRKYFAKKGKEESMTIPCVESATRRIETRPRKHCQKIFSLTPITRESEIEEINFQTFVKLFSQKKHIKK